MNARTIPSPKLVSTIRWLCLMVTIASTAATSSVGVPTDPSLGTWRNPKNSVHIRAEHCGGRMCGTVVWANEKAKADARKGSSDPLVGAQLFRDFVQKKPGVWQGRVFVPDIGKTFTGSVKVVDENTLEAGGCLLGHFGCKSQIWTRVRS